MDNDEGYHSSQPPKKDRKILRWMPMLALVVAIASAAFSYFQWQRAERLLTLSFPPNLRSGSAQIWLKGQGQRWSTKNVEPTSISLDMKIDGYVALINRGRSPATILESDCFFFIADYLPMGRPTFNRWQEKKVNNLEEPFSRPRSVLKAGSIASWSLTSDKDMVFGPGKGNNLYIIGNVIFLDDLGNPRSTYFVFLYHPEKRRFESIQDADYQGDD